MSYLVIVRWSDGTTSAPTSIQAREEAWGHVLGLMSTLDRLGAPQDAVRVAVVTKTHETIFQRYAASSGRCRWGSWGVAQRKPRIRMQLQAALG